jgi:hypothetical protein
MTRFARPRNFCAAAVAALFALTLSAAATGGACAEDGKAPAPAPVAAQQLPPPTAPAPSIPPQPPAANKPGFLHQLKVWWDDSIAAVDEKIRDARGKVDGLDAKADDATKGAADATKGAAAAAQDAVKGAVEATKNAATAIARLPNTRLIDVRETCATAPNGAPDCAAAAASGCRGKGFATGSPLDVRTAEKCDTTNLQAGQIPGQRVCAAETVVIRAVCQ